MSRHTATAIALTICAIVLTAGRHPGETWGDDFAQYILHARNLASGRAYTDTGHLFGIGAFLGPRAYPPMYPLVLAPIYALFGLNFVAFKLAGIAAIVAALWIWSRALGERLGATTPLWILLVGLHPAIRQFSDHVLSDPLFVFFSAASMAATMRWVEGANPTSHSWRRGAVIGLLAGCAGVTRLQGWVLVPMVPIVELIRTRRLSKISLAAVVAGSLVIGAGLLAVPDQLTYLDDRPVPLTTTLLRWTQLYGADVLGFLPGIGEEAGHQILAAARITAGVPAQDSTIRASGAPITAAAAVMLLIAMVGAVGNRNAPSLIVFPALTVAPLLINSAYSGPRLLLSILPILYFCLLSGVQRLQGWARWPHVAVTVAAIALALNLIVVPIPPYSPSILDRDAEAFFAFVRDSTPRDAVFVFPKPRALVLMTGRRGLSAGARSLDAIDRLVRIAGATHLVSSPLEADEVGTFARAHPDTYRQVYAADGYEVFARR